MDGLPKVASSGRFRRVSISSDDRTFLYLVSPEQIPEALWRSVEPTA